MPELPAEVAEALGPVEILVLNTGGPPLGGGARQPHEEWEAAYRSLVLAPRVLIEGVRAGHARARLGADRQRRLELDPRADPGLTLSNANRMAALGLLDTLAREVAGRRDHGQHDRDRPLRAPSGWPSNYGSLEAPSGRPPRRFRPARLGTPEEYGDLVAFVCSERAAYLTGTVIPLDGGLTRSN